MQVWRASWLNKKSWVNAANQWTGADPVGQSFAGLDVDGESPVVRICATESQRPSPFWATQVFSTKSEL